METPQIPDSSALRFRARCHTRWSDEDNQSVLNNAVYLTLFEEARHAYFGSLDLLSGNRFPFLLVQCNLRFLRPGRGGVDVVVELSTVHLGTSSLRQAYRVRAPDEQIWAEAEAVLVCYDAQSGASRPMEPRFRAAVARFEGLS
jgi:acyl-CoA thioester hydrolase